MKTRSVNTPEITGIASLLLCKLDPSQMTLCLGKKLLLLSVAGLQLPDGFYLFFMKLLQSPKLGSGLDELFGKPLPAGFVA